MPRYIESDARKAKECEELGIKLYIIKEQDFYKDPILELTKVMDFIENS